MAKSKFKVHKVPKSTGIKAVISKKTGDKGLSAHKASKSGRYGPIKTIAHENPKGRTILIPKNLLVSSGSDETSEEEKRLD